MSISDKVPSGFGRIAGDFLSGKPIWFFWVIYTLICAAVFGVFYLVMTILTLKWWVVTGMILLGGVIWGSISYTGRNNIQNRQG